MEADQDYLNIQETPSGPTAQGSDSALGEVCCAVRTRVFEAYVFIVSLLTGILIPVYLHWTRRPKEVRVVLRFWSRSFIFGARAILGIRYRIEGAGNIPDHPVIFAGNHQSCWESIAMTAFVPDINIVTKRPAMAIPVFGWGLKYAPMTPVDRDAPGQNIRRLVREAQMSITNGRSMLIFPEGVRVPPGERRPFQRGIELLYGLCAAPVVPFVTNAGIHWPGGFTTKRPGEIIVRFLPPIPPGQDPQACALRIERLLNEEKDRLPGNHPQRHESGSSSRDPRSVIEREWWFERESNQQP